MTMPNSQAFGSTSAATRTSASWRKIAEMVLGVSGAIAIALAASAEFIGGDPGTGPVEWVLYGFGLTSVCVATLMRYMAKDRRAEGMRFCVLMAEAALLYWVISSYEIEAESFHQLIFALVAAGFVGNHFTPTGAKPTFFLLLSLAAMFAILGPFNGVLLFAIGLLLIGTCHLPVPLVVRVGLLLVAATVLALARADVISVAWLAPVLPLLGSIFMFRLVVYIYDRRNQKGPTNLSLRLSYFFMLPNFAFPFFPVFDFTTWGRSYMSKGDFETCQRGMMWILIGVTHLLLYRLVNYHFTMDPEQVAGFLNFLLYAVTNFGLYLKISGLFHLILGCLYLFGFSLPETHSRFYLSFSFVEFWRRINIYWKDFMQKMVFNPSYTWLKRQGVGHVTGVVLSIVAVFAATWALHAYQWFWLRGSVVLTVPDTLFWSLLCAFLVAQTVKDAQPRKRGAVARIAPGPLLVLRTVATMLLIVILWSMWSSDTMRDWFALLSRSGFPLLDPNAEMSAWNLALSLGFGGFLFAITAIALGYTFGLAPPGSHPVKSGLADRGRGFRFGANARIVVLGTGLLLLAQVPAVNAVFPRDARLFIADMAEARLSARDEARLVRGYYENLTNVRMIDSDLWTWQSAKKPDRHPIDTTSAAEEVEDYRRFTLKPNVVMPFKGAVLSTNSFGMRDQEYTLDKPQGTVRIAVLGASRAMGTGVADDETFEAVIETSLAAGSGPKVEVLNFAVEGYDPFKKNLALEREAVRFAPDIAMLVSHNSDLEIRSELSRFIAAGALPGDYLAEPARAAGVVAGGDVDDIKHRLTLHYPDFVKAAYAEFAAQARSAGAQPVWVFLPSTQTYQMPLPETVMLKEFARDAGFIVIDMTDLYNSFDGDVKDLWIETWDEHPDWRGHQIIAHRLMDEMLAIPQIKLALGR